MVPVHRVYQGSCYTVMCLFTLMNSQRSLQQLILFGPEMTQAILIPTLLSGHRPEAHHHGSRSGDLGSSESRALPGASSPGHAYLGCELFARTSLLIDFPLDDALNLTYQ